MKKENTINKTQLYLYDPEAKYEYNINHGTEYEYNSFPKGFNGKVFKKTRFIQWEPIPEDIIIRNLGSQIFVNFSAVIPDLNEPLLEIFQMRSKRIDCQTLICEQINFFTALYDDDNDLITSMCIAKYITDSQTYTIETFNEYFKHIYSILFPPRTIEKIRLMVEENDVGDVTTGLFFVDCLRDIFIVSFMIKVMHIYIEHFVISTGNSPKDLYELFARTFTHIMDEINPNLYLTLYNYVHKNVADNMRSNSNLYDMQALDGVTVPTTAQAIMRKQLLCDGLIKLTFASAWDPIKKQPTYSCVGLIKAIVVNSVMLTRKIPLRYSPVPIDDIAQLLSDNITSQAPLSVIRSFNPGEYVCMHKDLNIIIAHIALEIDIEPVHFYLEHLTVLNDLSKLLIDTILYNKFHSSISTNTLSSMQKYILLMYVRHLIKKIYNLSEGDTLGNDIINILMGKTVSQSNKTLTQKDLNSIKKFVKANTLKEYLIKESNVNMFIENIIKCVLASYTIVNHNDPSLLNTQMVYDANLMTMNLLDVMVNMFEILRGNTDML